MSDPTAAISTAVRALPKEVQDRLNNVRIHSETNSLSVTLLHVGSSRGTAVAEACMFFGDQEFGEGTWYLNRVLVQDRERRGQGIGSYVLSLLQATLRFRPDCRRLLVEPGGYDNNILAQRRFYRKAGFVKKRNIDNVYVWNAK